MVVNYDTNGGQEPNPQFKSLNKVVLTKSGTESEDLVLIYGSDSELLELTDFNEYGWEFLVDKLKYNNEFPLNFLRAATKESIGDSLDDVKKVSKTFLPSLSQADKNLEFTVEGRGDGHTFIIGSGGQGMAELGSVIVLKGSSREETSLKLTIRKDYDSEVSLGLATPVDSNTWEFPIQSEEVLNLIRRGNLIFVRPEILNDQILISITSASLVSPEEPTDTIRYFGSITIGDQKLIMIKVPSGYSEADFYDTTDATNKPKIEVTFDETESKFSKLVWFVITNGDSSLRVSNINLSYFSWEGSINPHRNMNQYLLRNDDKAIIDIDTEVVENMRDSSDPLWMDLSSSTIVGNKVVSKHPLLDSRIRVAKSKFEAEEWRYIDYEPGDSCYFKGFVYKCIKENRGNLPQGPSDAYWKLVDNWDKRSTYRGGQTAVWNSIRWTSLSDQNIGNMPGFSNEWAPMFDQVDVGNYVCINSVRKVDNGSEDGGQTSYSQYVVSDLAVISPNQVALPKRDDIKTTFRVTVDPGYKFDLEEVDGGGKNMGKQIVGFENGNEESFLYDLYKNKGRSFNVMVASRSDLVNNPDFCFSPIYQKVSFYYADSSEINITEVVAPDSGGEVVNVIDLGSLSQSEYSIIDDNAILLDYSAIKNDRRGIKINLLGTQELTKVVKEYRLGNRLIESVVVDDFTPTGNFPIDILYPSSDIRYVLTVTGLTFRVSLGEYYGFYVSTPAIEVSSEEIGEIRIVRVDGTDSGITVDIEGSTIDLSVGGGEVQIVGTDSDSWKSITLKREEGSNELVYYTLTFRGVKKDISNIKIS